MLLAIERHQLVGGGSVHVAVAFHVGVQLVLVQRIQRRVQEEGRLRQIAAGHERHVGGELRRGRIERVARDRAAVDDRGHALETGRRGLDDLLHGQALQLGRIGRRDAQLVQHGLGGGRRLFGPAELQGAAALGHGPVEQAPRRRHAHQAGDLSGPAGLAEDGDIPGIAAERGDVVPHPFQRRHAVQHADIGHAGEGGVQVGEIEEAEDVQAVVDAHQHHVVARGQPLAAIPGRRAAADRIAAAVEPDHDRPPARPGLRRPHVQQQAVLALGLVGF